MTAVIEVRTYRAKPGRRDELLHLLRTRAFPLQRELGMKVLGPFPSLGDDVTFVWLRAFPSPESRDPMKEAFYGGSAWLGELEDLAMPLIDDYEAQLVDDTEGLWAAWPQLPGR
jgi:hypothetical protein